MSKLSTIFATLALVVVAVGAALYFAAGPEVVDAIISDVVAQAAEEETPIAEDLVTSEGDPDTATLAPDTDAPTLTITEIPFTETPTLEPTPTLIPPTATEVPREVGCGPACENLIRVIDVASVLPFSGRGFDFDSIDVVGAKNCIGFEEYVNHGGEFSGDYATCLVPQADAMRLCQPGATDWRIACSGEYTLAIFRVEGLVLTDFPFHSTAYSGGFMFPETLLTDVQYHLGGGYVPLMLPGDFTANSVEELRSRFLCVYQPHIDRYGLDNGNIEALAQNLVAGFPAPPYSGDLIRSNTNDWVIGGGRYEVRPGMALYWSNPWEQDCP